MIDCTLTGVAHAPRFPPPYGWCKAQVGFCDRPRRAWPRCGDWLDDEEWTEAISIDPGSGCGRPAVYLCNVFDRYFCAACGGHCSHCERVGDWR